MPIDPILGVPTQSVTRRRLFFPEHESSAKRHVTVAESRPLEHGSYAATFHRVMVHAPAGLMLLTGRYLKSVWSRTQTGISHYLEARKLLRGSISKRSRHGLDWLNFFLADIQTGFGAFVAFYLAELGWPQGQIGIALSAGTIAGLVANIPCGALVDWAPWKRALAAVGILLIAASAVILALIPNFVLIFLAQILHGISGGILTPAIAAISLGLVGRKAMSARTGRNYGFEAAGTALTAGAMGLAGQYVAKSAIFLGAAALCIPAFVALAFIRSDEINNARARNAGLGRGAENFQRLFDLGKNARLYVFAGCIFLFQFADASMLPVLGEELAQDRDKPTSVLVAGLIIVPQTIAALLSPWVGYHSERFGRKHLLLAGFVIEIVRALLFAGFRDYWVLVVGQVLSGISAATVTVLTVLVIADLTTGTGRFNLVQGFIATVIAIASSISTGATGYVFQRLGQLNGFAILAGAAIAAAGLLWTAMPETKPGKYLD
jgi:MFS family permease